MALRIVQEACQANPDRSKGVIVVESDESGPPFNKAFDELQDLEARQFAQAFASTVGIAPAHINGNTIGPYPVNKDGVPLDMVDQPGKPPLPPQHPAKQPDKYRIDVPVVRPFR